MNKLLLTLFYFSPVHPPGQRIRFFSFQSLGKFLPTFSVVQPSTPVLDLSTLELDVGTSIRLEKNQLNGCSNKEKENIAVPPQRCTIDREQLTAYRGFHLPSKCILSHLSSPLHLNSEIETSWGLIPLGCIYLGI